MSSDRDSSEKKLVEAGSALARDLPPPIALYQLATGHYLSRSLSLVAKLGIADLLSDGPRHCNDLAKSTQTHAASLRRVMRLLASAGIFLEEENGEFSLTAVGEYLRTDVPGSQRAMAMLFAGNRIQEAWRDLEFCVRTGQPAFRLRGLTNTFEDALRTPEEQATFDAAMADLTRLTSVAVASAYDFTPFRLLVDVGGGNGSLMVGILKANLSLRGIVFDQPAAIERAREQIEQHGLAARCTVMGGDFFKEVPAGGDGYILKHVIHDWDDERAATILKNCRGVMGPRSKLLVVEGVYPSRIDNSVEGRAQPLTMSTCWWAPVGSSALRPSLKRSTMRPDLS
jgi:hypothetical protein